MYITNIALFATLTTLAVAAPKTDTKNTKAATKGATPAGSSQTLPKNVPAPPAGNCAIVAFTALLMPIGGEGQVVDNDGAGLNIAPSEAGGYEFGVINTNREWVSVMAPLNPQSPGFKGNVDLDKAKIKDAGSLEVTADRIMVGDKHWGMQWNYKGQKGTGKDGKCHRYGETDHVLATYDAFSCPFPC